MNHRRNILITGASGLIGTYLTELLSKRGDSVSHLGRSKKQSGIKSFIWDIDKNTIDLQAFENTDTIIHLAGAGVADKRWTTSRKREILESRKKSSRLLFDSLKVNKHQVKTLLSASAIGYYGFEREEEIFKETSLPGKDFLAEVTRQWEAEVDAISTLGIRVVKIRIGIVLSEKGGALKEMVTPAKYFVGAPLGSGHQYVSWIHIDDLCKIFIKAVDDSSMQGAYNAVAPNPVTNRELTQVIAKALHKPLILPAVPGFVLKLVLGEMGEIVLKGNRVSSDKIIHAGYSFRFNTIQSAVNDLLND